jgi:hypothetical protein
MLLVSGSHGPDVRAGARITSAPSIQARLSAEMIELARFYKHAFILLHLLTAGYGAQRKCWHVRDHGES